MIGSWALVPWETEPTFVPVPEHIRHSPYRLPKIHAREWLAAAPFDAPYEVHSLESYLLDTGAGERFWFYVERGDERRASEILALLDFALGALETLLAIAEREQTAEEAEAELIADGVDVPAFLERMRVALAPYRRDPRWAGDERDPEGTEARCESESGMRRA